MEPNRPLDEIDEILEAAHRRLEGREQSIPGHEVQALLLHLESEWERHGGLTPQYVHQLITEFRKQRNS